MLRPTDHIPKYLVALTFHLLAQGCGEIQLCQDQGRSIPSCHGHISPGCVLSWPGQHHFLRNTEDKGHRVLPFGFIKWQWRACFWTGPFYPVAIKLRVTAAVPWHCLRNFLSSVCTSPRQCCCLMSFFPLLSPRALLVSWGGTRDGFFVTLLPHSCWEGFTSLNQSVQGVSELSKGEVSGVCVSCTCQERVTGTLSSLLLSSQTADKLLNCLWREL